ncbi:uncharacterized protein PHALS_12417 [Plasmopara halstedii]|uniref:Uncharacterized protein n=1 Tax=Plasmopara halstedii TaxID=4781 RepID=A0A0P1ALD1_PLAHL|nr:uncharacterized protein PHALS_12417 [Plasmopara halstedii]CEG42114.1 hypothetical protein PHALS_12417 [Plasmopara halstedii]|eukprot:XP_024578483.1 hypothetical protein PHALS_12417 [Plasmopara halstedii]
MHRWRSPVIFPSERSVTNDARVVELESDLLYEEPTLRLRLGEPPRTQLWDAIMRGLNASGPSCGTYVRIATPQLVMRHMDGMHDDSDDDSLLLGIMKHSKSNSERGRAYRARRKKYEDDLVDFVNSLHQEVADLDFLCNIRANKALHSRNSLDGSLVRLVSEYFALFERGMPSIYSLGQKRPALLMSESIDSSNDSFERKQLSFLECAMDATMQFGDTSGTEALIDQWRRYTSYHASINVVVVGVQVSGEEDNPLVTVRSDLHVVFSQATFKNVFPYAAGNKELESKFIGREIVYNGVNRFQFSPTGRISVYDSNVSFVESLVQAGATVSDIVLMMQQARIVDECKLGDTDASNTRVQQPVQAHQDPVTLTKNDSFVGDENGTRNADSFSTNSKDDNQVAQKRCRIDIDYLLS